MPAGGKREGAGRPKGTAAVDIIRKMMKEKNFDPLEEMVTMAQTAIEEKDPRAFGMCNDIAQYTVPKLKAVELSTAEDTDLNIKINLNPF